ncbi:BnaAnng09640D [Brassica napus]|uniref:BnaAnng09640D protein n=1 Tax=Brassica napus TaxID=3708 RepID=A0A078IEC5_BRANA|nr:BnaAnng09640D [Brassica napus]
MDGSRDMKVIKEEDYNCNTARGYTHAKIMIAAYFAASLKLKLEKKNSVRTSPHAHYHRRHIAVTAFWRYLEEAPEMTIKIDNHRPGESTRSTGWFDRFKLILVWLCPVLNRSKGVLTRVFALISDLESI